VNVSSPPVSDRPVRARRATSHRSRARKLGLRRSRARPLNPVLARELKERMRGRRAAVVLTLYLLLLTGVLYLVYRTLAGNQANPFEAPLATEVAAIGESVFEWLVFFMLLLVLFLVPGLTSGVIAGERERQTLVPLQVTLLRPRSIVLGKVAASSAFMILLLVATLPLLAVAYLIGGVTISEVAAALLAVLAVALGLASLSAACSTFFRRVQTATVASYGLVLLLVVGTLLGYAALSLLDRDRPGDPPGLEGRKRAILVLNPLLAVADVVGDEQSGDAPSAFDPLHELVRRKGDQPLVATGPGQVNGPVGVLPDVQPREDAGVDFWVGAFAALAALSLVGLALATRRLRTPAKVER
jgi:ABC-type transport system involved in multi-copper enzyme maturation permease subunit